jgi:hypothetical protein
MSDLPAPLTPPECDLRGYDFMPLFGHRLFRSDLYEQTDGEEFKCAVKLWWEAWNQCPAGSLPDDDAKLARLADLGRDVKTWRKMRDAVLRGFVLCSDGRLYHKALCEWAMEAYERRVRDRQRKRKWRDKGRDGDGDNPSPSRGPDGRFHPPSDGDNNDSPRHRDVLPPLTGEDRTGQERRGEEIKKDLNLSEEESLSRAGSEPEPSRTDIIGPDASASVISLVRKALKPTAYPPGRRPVRDAAEQIEAVAKPPPKSAHLTPEQLALVRRRTA